MQKTKNVSFFKTGLILLVLLPFFGFGQINFTGSLGYSETPVSKFDFSYRLKKHSVIATLQPNLTNSTKYPLMTAGLTYGYIFRTWQPYAGYSTQGIAYGVNKYLGSTVIGIGMQGKNPVITLGTTTLKKTGKDFLTGNDYAIGALQLISGFAMGWHEALNAKHWGNGKQFWDKDLSWRNKYKADGKNARFPGSTTWAVAVTDGYHLTNFISNTANIATLSFTIGQREGWNWKVIGKKVLISIVANRVSYYIAYEKVFVQ